MPQPAGKPDDGMIGTEALAWNPGGGQAWQLVHGVPVAMAPSGPAHGPPQSRLDQRIGAHLGGPCFVLITPGIAPRMRGQRQQARAGFGCALLPQGTRPHQRAGGAGRDHVAWQPRRETWGNVWA